jgi:2-polyprenyl-3-methyl-5-hydroxy-6-metoxy-1,4-benzoquinol methylase
MARTQKTVNTKKHIGRIIDSKDNFDVIECITCGFKHIIPLQTPEQLTKFYKRDFYTSERPNYFKDMKEDYAWWMNTYKNWYALLSNNLKNSKAKKKLLDIGSGPGYFLKCGKDFGWDVLGIEPSPHACEYARKLGVETIEGFFSKSLIEKYLTERKFDVITLTLVLEHVPQPFEFLKEAKKLLKPGGLLMVVSPNDYNLFQDILRKELKFKPWWVVPQHHINYFNTESMKQLLQRTGLKTVESMTTFPIDIFLLFGDNYIDNRKIGRAAHKKRKNFEQAFYNYSPEKLNDFYRVLAKNNIGREFVIIGKLD